MHLKSLLFPLVFCFSILIPSMEAQTSYRIYNAKGKAMEFEQMVKQLKKSDVIFFGEIHNQPIAHWLTLELIQEIDSLADSLVVGMEMFERDQQEVLDDLQNGIFELKKLPDYTKVWGNYNTDYKSIIEYCLKGNIPVIATNIPRRYASFVFSNGIDSLYEMGIPAQYLPEQGFPIDTNLATYSEVNEMAKQIGHGGGHLLEAQAIKDIAMAERIVEYIPMKNKRADGKFIHVNGGFHTKNKEGIAWYVHDYLNKKLSIAVISCSEVENVDHFKVEENNTADFHILINNKVTKSYE